MPSPRWHLGGEAHSAIGMHSALHTAQYSKNLDLIFVCSKSTASEGSDTVSPVAEQLNILQFI
jgi:hypothetical protein